MKNLRVRLVTTAMLGIGVVWVSAAAVRANDDEVKTFPTPHEVATFHEVEYPDAAAWSCAWQNGCLACKNSSGHVSLVVVAHIHKFPPVAPAPGEEEFHCVYPDQKVLTCGTTVIVPAPGTRVAAEEAALCPAR